MEFLYISIQMLIQGYFLYTSTIEQFYGVLSRKNLFSKRKRYKKHFLKTIFMHILLVDLSCCCGFECRGWGKRSSIFNLYSGCRFRPIFGNRTKTQNLYLYSLLILYKKITSQGHVYILVSVYVCMISFPVSKLNYKM